MPEPYTEPHSEQGTVIASHGNRITIEDNQGTLWPCHTHRSKAPVVCGDLVLWERQRTGNAIVTQRLPRQTELIRSIDKRQTRVLCANIQQIIIVNDAGTRQGDLPMGLIDHYLVGAELSGLDAIIVINKADLCCRDTRAHIEKQIAPYSHIGYTCLITSTLTDQNLALLRKVLHGKSSILLGQSGVGKSSLINRLIPDRQARVGQLTHDARHGRHTTTTTILYQLPEGGNIIDSPGVRAFIPCLTDANQIASGFREFTPFLGLCRYRNCTHHGDAGCALETAVANGQIEAQRLARYHTLSMEISDRSRQNR